MLGLEYIAALCKIACNVAFAIVTAIPSYYCWNCIAPKYLAFCVPELYQQFPYWHIVGILFLFTVIGEQIQKLFPTLANIKCESKSVRK